MTKVTKAYNPNQPRDDHGRWGSGSGISTDVYSPSEDDANIKLPEAKVPASGPLKIYHVTTTDSAKSIIENGFDKDAPNQMQGYESSVEGTYGWATKERAKMEVGRMAQAGLDTDDFAIMEVEVPRDQFKNLRPDEDFSLDKGEWKGSFEELQSVAYEGSVPKEWVTGVTGSKKAIGSLDIKSGGDFKLPPAKSVRIQAQIDKLPARHKEILSRMVSDNSINMSVVDIKSKYNASDIDSKDVERIGRLAYSFRKVKKMAENLTVERELESMDDKHSHTPFQYEGNVLGSLSESMVPRFFGALTDMVSLPTKKFKLADLTAMQNRVNTAKVDAIRNATNKASKNPLVVKLDGRHYIADGHHRATALWLNGADEMEAHFKDLDAGEESNAVKSADDDVIEIIKVDADQRVVYGWASVITEKGQPVIDTQGDIIEPSEMLKATTEYMKGERLAKQGHKGDGVGMVLHSFPLTFEIAKSLGIDTGGREGWITGMYITKDDTWEKVKSKKLKSFSIGARAVRVAVG